MLGLGLEVLNLLKVSQRLSGFDYGFHKLVRYNLASSLRHFVAGSYKSRVRDLESYGVEEFSA